MACRLTIITPCLNAATYIAEAVDSVAAQLPDDGEHLVIDGASTDDTLAILGRYPHLAVISHPDDGLYHALNEGIEQAQGEIIGFLNADDTYPPGTLAAVLEAFDETPDLDAVCGHAETVEDGRRIQYRRLKTERGWWPPELMFGAPCLNARFFRTSFVREVGPFSPRYRLAADREWLLSAARSVRRAGHLERPTITYRVHPGSKTLAPGAAARPAIVAQHLAIAEDLARGDGNRADARAWATWERWRLAGSAWDRLGVALRNPGDLRRAVQLKREVRSLVELD
ncbi:MAG: glycosyltransferase family 2 protein [Alphaproteobacteria bacterium]